MNNNSSTFQTIFLVILCFLIVIAVIVFSLGRSNSGTTLPTLTLWGTESTADFQALTSKLKDITGNDVKLNYVSVPEATFDHDLIEAIAAGNSPDLILLPDNLLYRYKDKIYPLPYTSYTQRQFKDTFAQAGEIFLGPTGVLALPFSIDPLVMYWNRDIMNDASVTQAPKLWTDFYLLAPKITKKDNAGNIQRSAIALGEFPNITHAKDILSALLLQSGNPIVTTNQNGGGYQSALEPNGSAAGFPSGEAAFRFFTQFADPTKDIYSWNRSLPQSKNYFLAGDLGVYIGPASEYSELQAKNGNLNFDVAMLPQSGNASTKVTFGKVSGLAVLKTSPHIADSFTLEYLLTSAASIGAWSSITHLPPIRRDLLANPPADSYSPVFYASAISAKNWLDPEAVATSNIFQTVVEDTLSGKTDLSTEVQGASDQLDVLLK